MTTGRINQITIVAPARGPTPRRLVQGRRGSVDRQSARFQRVRPARVSASVARRGPRRRLPGRARAPVSTQPPGRGVRLLRLGNLRRCWRALLGLVSTGRAAEASHERAPVADVSATASIGGGVPPVARRSAGESPSVHRAHRSAAAGSPRRLSACRLSTCAERRRRPGGGRSL
jgi:hypothetical protein